MGAGKSLFAHAPMAGAGRPYVDSYTLAMWLQSPSEELVWAASKLTRDTDFSTVQRWECWCYWC
ncbi:MAG: hypothetical protein L0Z53_06575 [Acidobacteriales bacterium]|nr:hypothetical protein [Terriglobales bacterium]